MLFVSSWWLSELQFAYKEYDGERDLNKCEFGWMTWTRVLRKNVICSVNLSPSMIWYNVHITKMCKLLTISNDCIFAVVHHRQLCGGLADSDVMAAGDPDISGAHRVRHTPIPRSVHLPLDHDSCRWHQGDVGGRPRWTSSCPCPCSYDSISYVVWCSFTVNSSQMPVRAASARWTG